MEESKEAKYGTGIALWINDTIDRLPEPQRGIYRRVVIQELRAYSFEEKRRNPNFLAGIREVDIHGPKNLAKLVKQGLYLIESEQSFARVLNSLLEHL